MDLGAVSFVVAKEDLASAVSWVARNLPTKPAQPVLRAMLITADDDGLEFAGFDYEVSTKVRIPAEVNQPGRIAVAGKLIADITATLPNKPVEIFVDGSTVQLKCGSSRFELPSIPLDDYPTRASGGHREHGRDHGAPPWCTRPRARARPMGGLREHERG